MSRTVPDPFQSPYDKMAGIPARFVSERLLPNGKWEFEDIRPQGPTGRLDMGNEANAGAGYGAASDPRMQSLVAQQVLARRGSASDQAAAAAGETQTDTGYTPQLQAQQKRAAADKARMTGQIAYENSAATVREDAARAYDAKQAKARRG